MVYILSSNVATTNEIIRWLKYLNLSYSRIDNNEEAFRFSEIAIKNSGFRMAVSNKEGSRYLTSYSNIYTWHGQVFFHGQQQLSQIRNEEIWINAKEQIDYSATLLMICGAALTILGIISLFLPDMDITGMFIGIGILMVVLTGIIAATEIHLYKVFDKNGNRRA